MLIIIKFEFKSKLIKIGKNKRDLSKAETEFKIGLPQGPVRDVEAADLWWTMLLLDYA